jgi:serine/threonine protein kinase
MKAEATPAPNPQGLEPEGALEPPAEVLRILEKYVEELEAGGRPNAAELLAQHPQLAEHLKGCLASLEFLYQAEPTSPGPSSVFSCPLQESPSSESRANERGQQTTNNKQGTTDTGQLGDFRILRQVGRGGMGVVYEAEQISLQRRVALKVLPFAGAMDPKLLQRFRNEAQAAAGLHHQNIVPVYAVGSERGMHYYAMQFIEGRTLAALIQDLRRQHFVPTVLADTQQAAGRASPSEDADFFLVGHDDMDPSAPPRVAGATDPTQLLLDTGNSSARGSKATIWSTKSPAFFRHVAELGRQAANGLEYAHARGVIHRDIKPANLLIDQHGNLWIADFGLARLPSDLSLTLSGDFLGTLPYMSPEQALGEHALVDQRTDVYSLGMTLYELLTLQVAFGGRSREGLLRQIAFDEPRPLRKLNAAVPSDLETIVLKAIAKCPEERYATAQEFADDLTRFLEDKPIRARRPNLVQRFNKLTKRHRGVMWAIVSCWAIAMIVGLFGLGFHSARIGAQNEQIKDAFEKETKQRRRAEATANLAFRALDEIAMDAGNAFLGTVERDERTRLRKVLRLYQQVVETNDNITTRLEWGHKQLWIGSMQRSVGEKYEEVEATLRGAIRCFKELATASPAEPYYRDLLAQGYNELGLALGEMGKPEEGLRAMDKTIELYQELAEQNPSYRPAAANYMVNKGLLLQSQGRFKKAEVVYRQCLEPEANLTRGCSWSAILVLNQAAARFSLARLMAATGRHQDAEKAFRRTIETLTQLRDLIPDLYVSRARLGSTYHDLALLLQSTGRTRNAEDSFLQALKLQKSLVQQFPKLPEHRLDLASSQHNLAVLLKSQGKWKQADQYFCRCQKLLEGLTADFPHVSLYQSDLAKHYSNRGNYFREQKQLKEAEKFHRDAVRVYQKLIKDKDSPDFRAELADCLINLGELLEETGKLQEAETAYRQALDIFTHLPADFALLSEFQSNLGTTYHNLARALSLKSEWSDAWQLAIEAIPHHVKALKMNTRNPSYRRAFFEGLLVLGKILFQQVKDLAPLTLASPRGAEDGVRDTRRQF